LSASSLRAPLSLAAALLFRALPGAAAAPAEVAIQCGRVIDGLAPEGGPGSTVLVRGGRIVEVVPGKAVPAGAKVIDLAAFTCLPGLIDLHTHLAELAEDTADLSIYFRRGDQEVARIAADNARATLHAGFTTVRNVGTYIAWSDRALRDEIAAGRVAGPRVQAAGFYLTIPGGGGDLVLPGVREADIPPRVRRGVARGPEAFAARASEAIAGGADVLKVIASGAVLAFGGVPGAPEMTREEIAAVVAVAHRSGRKVAAHAHGAASVRDAILAGADTIEHASLIDAEGIRLARERGVGLVMDVWNGDYIETEGRRQKWPEEFLRKNLETTEAQRQAFARAVAAGAILGYGTDAGVYPHGGNARQLRIMVERGMTPMAAIQAATSVAARLMGWEDRVGALEPGRYADLIAVRGDPLRDVRLLESVEVVVQGGQVVKDGRNPSPGR
jgi:imidazolonepropionase-like amidohydrolase